VIQHILKFQQSGSIQPKVVRVVVRVGHATLKGILSIIDVKLGKAGSAIRWRQKGSNPM